MNRWILCALALLVARTVPAASPFTLLRSGADGAVVQVSAPLPRIEPGPAVGEAAYTVPGWSVTSKPGVPGLPRCRCLLALPPGTDAVMTVNVLASSFLPGPAPVPAPHCRISRRKDGMEEQTVAYERDPEAYATVYPAQWAHLGDPAGLRSMRVVPIDVYPYRWDPRGSGVRIATRMEIEVRFVSGPALRPREAGTRMVPVVEDPRWQRIYQQSVLNAGQAGPWLRSPARWRSAGRHRTMAAAADSFRIMVDHDDIYRIDFDSLAAAGWDLGAVPVSQLALVEHFYVEADSSNPFHENAVPMVVRDNNGNGTFDSGDDLYFFGETAWDRLRPAFRDKRYGRDNAYWLTVRPEGGARMAQDSSFVGSPLPPEASFLWTDHLEGDAKYMYMASNLDKVPPQYLSLGADAVQSDHFFWFGEDGADLNSERAAFNLPGFLSAVHLRLQLNSMKKHEVENGVSSDASLWFRVGSPESLVPLLPDSVIVPALGQTRVDLDTTRLAPLHLQGSSTVLAVTEGNYRYGASVNWMEWTYWRSFTAFQRRLAWSTNSLQGRHGYAIAGLDPADAPLLFDVSDSVFSAGGGPPRGPRWLSYTPSQWQHDTLRVQLDLGPGGAARTLIALNPAGASTPRSMSRVADQDLLVPAGTEENLITITVPDFVSTLAPLMEQRRADGLSPRVVNIQEVYDEFNGGRAWPTAIRNYLRYLWRTRTAKPSYLLLVGKASEDFAHVLSSSLPNLVPTQTLFSTAYEDQGPELVATDEWFVDNLSDPTIPPEQLDFLPDMAVGRLPVSTVDQCQAVVQKILDYHDFQDSDSWRTRGLFVSDDEYSGSTNNAVTNDYLFSGYRPPGAGRGDSVFRWTSEQVVKMIHNDAGFIDFPADSFYTACYMDTVACLGRCANPVKNGNTDCAYWRCPVDTSYSGWHQRSWYNGVVPYYGSDYSGKTDSFYYGSTRLPPILRSYMNGEHGGGYLFLNYQGHANIGIMSHEYIFVDVPFLRQDIAQLHNAWPFVYMGFGCQLAVFSSFVEKNQGDCLADKLLLLNDPVSGTKGAIASFASTAFEWESANQDLDLAWFHAWFVDPPKVNGRSQWVLGDIMTGGKTYMMSRNAQYGGDYYAEGMVETYTLMGDPSMPMEMGPPAMDVRVNCGTSDPFGGCRAWQDGATLAADPDTGSVINYHATVRARLTDEAQVAHVSITEGGVALPESAYRIVADPLPPSGRAFYLVYRPYLQPPLQDYDVVIKATDNLGLDRSVTLPVQMATRFSVRQHGIPVPFQARDILPPGDTVQVVVTSPVDLTEPQLVLWVDDAPLSTLATPTINNPRQWTALGVLPSLAEGSHQLQLQVHRPDGQYARRESAFSGPIAGDTQLREVYNFPNPFESSTRFHFWLSRDALWARMRLFTISGRRIWQWQGAASTNDNWIPWDGRDADGGAVANGLYFYKLEIHTAEGKTLSRIDKLARIR